MPAIAQVYLVEVVEERKRNLFGTVFAVSISIGITLTYIFGYLMSSYELVCWTFSAIVILLIILVSFVPESPVWLQQSGRLEDSLSSARKLWGPQFELKNEKKEKVSFQNFRTNILNKRNEFNLCA